MRNKDEKLLAEAYMRILLKEEEFPGDESQFAQAYQKAIVGQYIPFIQWLKKYSDDKRIANVINVGQQDGNQADDALKASTISQGLPVIDLLPTQKEIGIAASLAWPLDKPDKFASLFSGAPVNPGPVIVLNSKYILDGHHRWSQTFCYNPKASLVVINYENPNFEKEGGLKVIQAAIAALKPPGTQLQTKPNNEPNLLICSLEEVRKVLNPTQEVLQKAVELQFCTDLKTFQDKVISNVEILRNKVALVAKDNPPRSEMPQPALNKVGDQDLASAIQSGAIDAVTPFKRGAVAQQQAER